MKNETAAKNNTQNNDRNKNNINNLKAVYTLMEDEKFINPYNFISINFNSKKTTNINKEENEKLKGELECAIYPKTAICVPDNPINKEEKHKKYPFFNYDGVPAIPGSSLRGMIRSLYETASDSCFSTAKEHSIVTNRSITPFKPGILKMENGEWKLYKAKRLSIKKELLHGFKFGENVAVTLLKKGEKCYSEKRDIVKTIQHIEVEEANDTDTNDLKKGYLFIGEEFGKIKKYESVFCQNDSCEIKINKEILKKNVEKLNDIYKIYYDNSVKAKKNHTPYKGYENALRTGVIPIWYNPDSLKLSFACIGRYGYNKNVQEILNAKAPCKSRNKVCKACKLFGMATEEKIGSSIRVTDAMLSSDKDSYEKRWFTFQPLGSPKIGYLPFYLNEPYNNNIKDWSYDNTDIRGRKFYWHSDKIAEEMSDKSDVNATAELIYPKNDKLEFRFNIYYNDITKEQLDEIIWTVTLGENYKDSSLCYKIGHGKPLGLGSAKIVIINKKQRDFYSDYYKLTEETIKEQIESPFDAGITRKILTAVDMNTTKGKNVSYPFIKVADEKIVQNKTDAASMKWFSENYKLGQNSIPNQYLPKISDKVNSDMKAYELSYEDKSDNNKTNIKYKKEKFTNNIFASALTKLTDENNKKETDKNKEFEATVTKTEGVPFPIIKLNNESSGTLSKKNYSLKKGDKIKVKFMMTDRNSKNIYKFIDKI